ncbi:hypothetical protein RMONA_03760 [Rickettsia monacensis]|uniref:Integrase catalytic domain-containing protein n=1 Tax=Rickettsia monacensis TaxID=109232 RepID=A0A0B7J490_9RICK|nr:hypothetical protein RMONA_3330 [Rickettsia monacensis IrR/Munich]CEO17139.1 hypothetical protein RMONA_03760 [Rickettsia monacensis]
MQEECYHILFRKKFYNSLDELQTDIDNWLVSYNNARPHSGKHCFGKTPMQSFTDSLYIAKDKNIGNIGNIDKNIGNIERISDNLMIAHQAALLLNSVRLSRNLYRLFKQYFKFKIYVYLLNLKNWLRCFLLLILTY